MGASAPKFNFTGSQTLVKKNPRPNLSNAGIAAYARAPIIATSVPSTNSAKHIVVRSNSQSCQGGALRVAGGGVGFRWVVDSIEAGMAAGIGAVAVDIITPPKRKCARGSSPPECT